MVERKSTCLLAGLRRHLTCPSLASFQYALFEELDTKDVERVRQIYEACIKLIPHKSFTFAKVWSLFAQFEVRQLNIDKARKILGTAIGMCPKEKLFKEYITLELQLREFDRCRQLYQKYLTVSARLHDSDGRGRLTCDVLRTVRCHQLIRLHPIRRAREGAWRPGSSERDL